MTQTTGTNLVQISPMARILQACSATLDALWVRQMGGEAEISHKEVVSLIDGICGDAHVRREDLPEELLTIRHNADSLQNTEGKRGVNLARLISQLRDAM